MEVKDWMIVLDLISVHSKFQTTVDLRNFATVEGLIFHMTEYNRVLNTLLCQNNDLQAVEMLWQKNPLPDYVW